MERTLELHNIIDVDHSKAPLIIGIYGDGTLELDPVGMTPRFATVYPRQGNPFYGCIVGDLEPYGNPDAEGGQPHIRLTIAGNFVDKPKTA